MRSRVLAVGAVAALTAALTGGPVHAASPSLTANQAFDTLAAERGLAGFAGVTNDGSRLTLWWKGAPPAAVTNRLTAARSSFPIVVRRAAYSMAEIRRAAEPIKALLAHPQPHLRGVMIPPDGHGLELVTDGSPDALKGLPAVGVPVSVRVWTNFSFLDSRLDDSSPWSGGGRLKIYDGSNYLGYCTTGWGVHSASGTRYLLTAAHCGKTGTRFTDGAGEFIGYGNQDRNDLDIMLIPTYSANNMWDGPVASGNFLKWVAGSDDARPNDQLCTSGSTSGAVCGITIPANASFAEQICGNDAYGEYHCAGDLVYAEKYGSPASQPGDSGGPVFSTVGSNQVTVKGTITGGGYDPSRNVYILLFQDFVTAQRTWGISVNLTL